MIQNQAIKSKIILFYSSIILLLPVVNGLHFILIDHSNPKEIIAKKHINHPCDHYVLYQIYYSDFPEFEINNNLVVFDKLSINEFYQNNYELNISINHQNKGPPCLIGYLQLST